MPNPKMTKTVKKKPGKVRTFINSIIFNRETPKQGRKRKEKEKQNLAATKKQQAEYDKMEFKRGGKLKRKVKKYNLGGFMEKASPFLGAAGMIASKFAKKKKGGTMKYKRGGQFNQYD